MPPQWMSLVQAGNKPFYIIALPAKHRQGFLFSAPKNERHEATGSHGLNT
jgi:hypothetical protein